MCDDVYLETAACTVRRDGRRLVADDAQTQELVEVLMRHLFHLRTVNQRVTATHPRARGGQPSPNKFLPTGVAQRSEVDVFSGVCLFVCQHDNFRTIKRRMMKLGGYVHCTQISPEFEFGSHRPNPWVSTPQKVAVCGVTTRKINGCGRGRRGPPHPSVNK